MNTHNVLIIIYIFIISRVIAIPILIALSNISYDNNLEERYHNSLMFINGLYYAIDTIYYNKTDGKRLANAATLELNQILGKISHDNEKKKRICDLITVYGYLYSYLFDNPIYNRRIIEQLCESIKFIYYTRIEIG